MKFKLNSDMKKYLELLIDQQGKEYLPYIDAHLICEIYKMEQMGFDISYYKHIYKGIRPDNHKL